jgi:hypothetical protein
MNVIPGDYRHFVLPRFSGNEIGWLRQFSAILAVAIALGHSVIRALRPIDANPARFVSNIRKGKFASFVDDSSDWPIDADHTANGRATAMTTSRVFAALLASAVTVMALPTAASAGCYGCYTPPPCPTCYQRQVAPPQYRAFQETVMVAPGGVIAHRTPAQYRTVMVPQTVMVAPEGVQYQQIPAQYTTRQRVEMVAPAREYYVAVRPRCGSCGY